MDTPNDTPKPRWSALQLAFVKAAVVAGVLAGAFLVIPGKWDWRITLIIAGAFGLNTFVFSLLASWARKKVTAHLTQSAEGGNVS